MTKTRIGVLPYYRGAWKNTETYGLDNRVTDGNGDYYTSLKDDNLNHPLTDTEWWARNTYSKENKDAISAESARATAEGKRVTAENGRVTAEGKRVTAENGRVTAENGRVSAESTRVSNESARATAERNRETTVNSYMTVIKKPIVSTSDTTVNMDANKLYNITVGSALTLNINAATDTSITNDWEGCFDTGETVPTVTWPENVNWGTSYMTLSANNHYEFSIRQSGGKYYGILYGWTLG